MGSDEKKRHTRTLLIMLIYLLIYVSKNEAAVNFTVHQELQIYKMLYTHFVALTSHNTFLLKIFALL